MVKISPGEKVEKFKIFSEKERVDILQSIDNVQKNIDFRLNELINLVNRNDSVNDIGKIRSNLTSLENLSDELRKKIVDKLRLKF